MAARTLEVTFLGNAAPLQKAMGEVEGGVGKAGKSLSDLTMKVDGMNGPLGKLSSALGGVAKIAAGFVIGGGLLKLPGILGGSMSAASDFNETLSKSRAVFGDQSAAIEAWAATAAKSFGQSKTQALDAAGAFGNMFTQLGIGSEKAAEMSEKMVELASDFASFHNADITEVIDAQAAAFRGEYDALQKFVPTINAAAVEAKALEMGLAGSTRELTAQDKALATQALMLEGAGKAMGDFANTADGAANKQRILEARMADLSVTIGQKLLPMKVALLGVVLDHLIPAFEKFWGWVDKVWAKVEEFKNNETVIQFWFNLRDALGTIAGLTFDAITALAGLAFDGLKSLAGLAWGVMQGAWAVIGPALDTAAKATWKALTDLAGVAWEAMQKAWEVIQPLLEKAAGYAWDALTAVGDAAWGAMAEAWSRMSDAVAKFPWDKVKEGGGDTSNWAAAWDKVAAALAPVMAFLKPFAEHLIQSLKDDLRAVGDSLAGVGRAFHDLGEALRPLSPLLEPLGKALGVLGAVAVAALIVSLEILATILTGTIVGAINTVTGFIKSIAVAIDFVTTAVTEWPPKIGAAFLGVWNTITANVDLIKGKLLEILEVPEKIATGLISAFAGMSERLYTAAFNMAKRVYDAVKDALGDLWPFSPSKRGIMIGEGLGSGIEVGLANSLPDMLDAVEAVGAEVAEAWRRSGANGVDLSTSVPLWAVMGSPALRERAGDTSRWTAAGGAVVTGVGGGQVALMPTKPQVGDAYGTGNARVAWDGERWVQSPETPGVSSGGAAVNLPPQQTIINFHGFVGDVDQLTREIDLTLKRQGQPGVVTAG
ncbi:MAG: hypothetical protein ACKVVT_15100 [Dehalococcoidia bacterium]